MRTSRSPTNLVLVAFGALLIAGGVVVTFAELRPFLRASDTPPARMLTLAEGKTEHGFSTSARQLFLFDCRSAIISLFARIQTEAVRRSLNQNCLSASDRLAAEQPTFSIAWLTGALAASQLEDWDGFNLRLEHSQRTGPTEQWIAQIR
nr:hypothetical protein [Pseudomonas sp.]